MDCFISLFYQNDKYLVPEFQRRRRVKLLLATQIWKLGVNFAILAYNLETLRSTKTLLNFYYVSVI